MLKNLIRAMSVLVVTIVSTLAPVAAQALTVQVINTDGMGVASRYAPRVAATNGYGAPAGATVSTICFTNGEAVGSNGNSLWWLISYAGRQFYVADRYLSTPYVAGSTPSEPRCDSAPTSTNPAIWLGSPVDGTWDLPASSGGDGPRYHWWLRKGATDNGDWSIDLPAAAGQGVYLYAAPQVTSTSITAKVDRIGDACGGGYDGGKFVTVGLYSGAVRVGSATYAHINPSVSVGQTLPRWGGAALGTVGHYTRNSQCWTGPHVHFQLWSAANYACFNKGWSLGQAVRRTNFLGFTGGAVASAARQACA